MRKLPLLLLCLLCGLSNGSLARAVSPGAGFDLIDGAYWYYNDYDMQVLVRYPGSEHGWEVCGEWAGMPVPSPNRAQLAFLDPWEFESLSHVHVYDVATRELSMLALRERGREQTPMRIIWLDDRTLLLTVGYVYDTVSFGGDLHYYDLETGRNAKIVAAQDVQITDVTLTGDTARLEIRQEGRYYFKTGNYAFSSGPYIYTVDMPVARLKQLMAQKQTDSIVARPQIVVTSGLWSISGWLYANALNSAGLDAVAVLRAKTADLRNSPCDK